MTAERLGEERMESKGEAVRGSNKGAGRRELAEAGKVPRLEGTDERLQLQQTRRMVDS